MARCILRKPSPLVRRRCLRKRTAIRLIIRTEIDRLIATSGGVGDIGKASNPSLLHSVTFTCTIGEDPRVLALFVAHEIAPHTFSARAKSVRVIGGRDLLGSHFDIPGRFPSLDAASAASAAWATAFNRNASLSA